MRRNPKLYENRIELQNKFVPKEGRSNVLNMENAYSEEKKEPI